MRQHIVKTKAVVLKRMDYQESSRIVTLFTREEGKVSVLAKGARSRRNRFGAALEPGSIIQVVYYTKPHRELQTLTQAETIPGFHGISGSLPDMTGALHLLDLVQAVTDRGERHPELYELLVSALGAVNNSDAGLPALLVGFRMKLLAVSGLSPELQLCVGCGGDMRSHVGRERILFDIGRGGVICEQCQAADETNDPGRPAHGTSHVRLRSERVTLLRDLLERDFTEYEANKVGTQEWNELDGVLRLYERHHVLQGRMLKTESMVREFIP